jgi:hypothetical protein
LTAYGYVESALSSLTITGIGEREASHVDGDTARAVLAIVSRYGKTPLNTLLRDVYCRYPWYASKSDRKDLVPANMAQPKEAPIAVYTMGYEERSVDGFLNKLLRNGIKRIVDVRANPVSRKYGFARSSLSALAAKLGLGYYHCPELGISSAKRRGVETPSEFRELFGYYERQILPTKTDEVAKVAAIISRLAAQIANLTGLNVVHL